MNGRVCARRNANREKPLGENEPTRWASMVVRGCAIILGSEWSRRRRKRNETVSKPAGSAVDPCRAVLPGDAGPLSRRALPVCAQLLAIRHRRLADQGCDARLMACDAPHPSMSSAWRCRIRSGAGYGDNTSGGVGREGIRGFTGVLLPTGGLLFGGPLRLRGQPESPSSGDILPVPVVPAAPARSSEDC